MPRSDNYSKNIINVDTRNPEDYFHIYITNYLYDDYINRFKEIISKHKTVLSSL